MLATVFIAWGNIIIDTYYMGLCFYIFGLFKDFKENIQKLDRFLEEFGAFGNNNNVKNYSNVDFYEKINKVVRYHVEIYE